MVKTALFVDFDNVYLGLERVDRAAAERFATDPQRWLEWFEGGLMGKDSPRTDQPRSVLVRKCYLNPKTFHAYRPYFTRCAFEVIDCPPLTRRAKNSSDIRMVMDILDALEHPTRFEEFVILSGDADFTPVLLRLRAHDRRTAVLAVGFAAEAYKAACDHVVLEEVFVEDALGIVATPTRPSIPPPMAAEAADVAGVTTAADILQRVATKLTEAARRNHVLLPRDVVQVLRTFPEFTPACNWFGYFSLKSLAAELCRRSGAVELVGDGGGDTWCLAPIATAAPTPTPTPTPISTPTSTAPAAREPDLTARIVASVRRIVDASSAPVPLAKAAQSVIRDLGSVVVESSWAGAGSFKALLRNAGGKDLRLLDREPGFVWDAARALPEALRGDEAPPVPSPDPVMEDTIERRVSRLTGVPALRSEEYAVLFQTIAEELAANEFSLNSTAKAVRDYLSSQEEPVPRAAVTFVLRGLTYDGLRLDESPRDWSPGELAQAFFRNALSLCEDVELALNDDERERLRSWLCGSPPPRAPPPP